MAMLAPGDLAAAARFTCRLGPFLRRPIGAAEARAALAGRLARREDDFLSLARVAIYGNPRSPYRALLLAAGCSFGDLERLVRRDTVEGALRALLREGVYLTVDELKGRRVVTRGGMTFSMSPSGFRNPRAGPRVLAKTGGSRGLGVPLLIDLAFIRDRAVSNVLSLVAWGDDGWEHATWGVPGGAIVRILDMAAAGRPPTRWFSQVDPRDPTLPTRYRWSAWVTRGVGRLAGVSLPSPVYVPPDEPMPIVAWMADVLRAGRIPHLHTFASSAVRVCLRAARAGIRLDGARFTMSGEPVTAARLAAAHRVGAIPRPCYSSMESGPIGYGCLAPSAPDDTHLLHDMSAVVGAGEAGPAGLPTDALFVTSIRPTASPVLLNVALGDQAIVESRTCGCPMEALGWTRHIHSVRSYEKLTVAGMTFLDVDVIRVLEVVLPGRFGGAATDYQLVEEEGDEGRGRLTLRVHPGVGPVPPGPVAEVFLDALSHGSFAGRVMTAAWRNAKLLRVVQEPPATTPSGKIQHLHSARPPRR